VPLPQSVEMHRALNDERRGDEALRGSREPARLAGAAAQLFKGSNVELDWFETNAMKRKPTPGRRRQRRAREAGVDGLGDAAWPLSLSFVPTRK